MVVGSQGSSGAYNYALSIPANVLILEPVKKGAGAKPKESGRNNGFGH